VHPSPRKSAPPAAISVSGYPGGDSHQGELRGSVGRSGGSTVAGIGQGCAEQLARFFPQTKAVRVPVQVTSSRGGKTRLREATVVEFGGTEHAIFLSTLPLEFDDRLRLEGPPDERPAEATVVAVQYHEGRKAVAVRFSRGPCHWVTQP
jgi:hypothetical protein